LNIAVTGDAAASIAEAGATPSLRATEYRADIDGLRAIAVLSVVGFHAFPNWVPGGFIGVDVFFVISGFLISTIIIADLESRRFSFTKFYSRRIKRIFPALILVLAACLAFGWLVLFSNEYKSLGKHVAGSATFLSNFLLWAEAGYFDSAAETKPLLHLWSLGIEEQFYIFWPLLLYLATKLRLNLLFLILFLLIATFAINIAAIDTTADFYSPLARFWELLIGGALAYMGLYRLKIEAPLIGAVRSSLYLQQSASDIKALCGLVLIVLAIFFLHKSSHFPGWQALLPTTAAYLVLSAGPAGWLSERLFANRGMVWVGLISYPLYLWHWPLLSFARIMYDEPPAPKTAFLVILISVLLAWFTYLFLEMPIRFGKPTLRKVGALILVLGSIGCTGYIIQKEDGFPFRQQQANDSILAAADDWLEPPLDTIYHGVPAWAVGNPNAGEEIFVGDSNMQQYYPRVRELTKQLDMNNHRIVFLTSYGCPPIPGLIAGARTQCTAFLENALPLLHGKSVKKVIFGALWTNPFMKTDYYMRGDGPSKLLRNSEIARDHALNEFKNLISQLVQEDKGVFVILEIPRSPTYDPKRLLPIGLSRLEGKAWRSRDNPSKSDMLSYNGDINHRLADIAIRLGAKVINPIDYLCNKDVCPASTSEGRFIYRDSDHLSATFVRQSATYIDAILF